MGSTGNFEAAVIRGEDQEFVLETIMVYFPIRLSSWRRALPQVQLQASVLLSLLSTSPSALSSGYDNIIQFWYVAMLSTYDI